MLSSALSGRPMQNHIGAGLRTSRSCCAIRRLHQLPRRRPAVTRPRSAIMRAQQLQAAVRQACRKPVRSVTRGFQPLMSWPWSSRKSKAYDQSVDGDAPRLSHRLPSTQRPAQRRAGRVPTANPNEIDEGAWGRSHPDPQMQRRASSVHKLRKALRGGLVIVWSLVDARWRANAHWNPWALEETPGAGRSQRRISADRAINGAGWRPEHLRSHRDQTGRCVR